MPSAAQDTDEESEQDVTPQAKPTAQKSAPNEDNEASDAQPAEQSDSYETPANAVMPAQRDRGTLTRSFAAQGYGAPSKDYQGAPLAPPEPEAPQDLQKTAYDRAKSNWQQDNPNTVQDDLADSRQGIEADLAGKSFTPRSEPDDRYLRAADQEVDQEARAAMQSARAQRIEEMRQQKAQQGQVNDQNENAAIASGQMGRRDSTGTWQPIMDPETGRPLYKTQGWKPSTDPKTGEIALEMRDKYGQRQFRAPDIVHNPDLSDNHAYYKVNGQWVDSGKDLEDFAQSKNPRLRVAALDQITKRNTAQRKQALEGAEAATQAAQLPYIQAQQQREDLANQQQENDAKDAVEQDPAKKAAYQSQSAYIKTQTDALDKQIAPGGDLYHQYYAAGKELARAKAEHVLQTYLDQANAQKERLAQNPNDPKLQAAVAANQEQVANAQKAVASLTEHTDALRQAKANKSQPVGQPVSEGVGQPLSEPNEFQKTEPAQLAAQGVKNIGAFTPQELAAKYGDGTGPVQPASLVKIAQRVNDLNTTLSEASKPSALPAGLGTDQASTNVDPKITASMTEERDYLQNLAKQRYAQLQPGDRAAVDKMIGLQSGTSAPGAFFRHLGLAAAPSAVGFGGMVLGGKAGASIPGPAGVKAVGGIVGSLGGAFAGSMLANWAQNKAIEKASPDAKEMLDHYLAVDDKEHPYAAEAGDFLANLPFFKVAPKAAAHGLVGLMKALAGKNLTPIEKAAAKTIAAQAGIATANVGASALKEGKLPDSAQLFHDYASQLILGEQRFGGHGAPPEAGQPSPKSAPVQPAEPIPAEHLANPPPTTLAPAAPTTTDVGQPGNPAQPPGSTPLEVPHSEPALVAEAPKPENAEAANKMRSSQKAKADAESAKAINLANRQRLKELGHEPEVVDKMSSAEVAAMIAKEHPALSTETKTTKSGDKSNEQATASNTETVRDQGGQEGRAGGRGESPGGADVRRAPAERETAVVAQEGGGGREGDGPQEPRARGGGGDGIPATGTAAEPAPRDTPVGGEPAPSPHGAPRGVPEEPRRADGGAGEAGVGAPQSGRGSGSGELIRPESVEHLGKRELALQGQGEPVDQYQVRIKGEDRGRTMTKADMEREGIDTSNLPTKGEPKNAVPVEGSKPVDVQPAPENGEAVGGGNAVDQGAPAKGEAKGTEAVPEKPVESEGNGLTKDELKQRVHEAISEARDALKRGDKKAGKAAMERAHDLQKQIVDFDKNAKAKAKAENPSKPKKTKFASVGPHPAGHPDILNTIEENGGVQTKSGAGENAGGEHDDLASSFTGRAKMLLRKKGMKPDDMAKVVHEAGHTTEGTVTAMNDAVSRAVADREKSARDMGKQALHDRFDRAFIGNEHPRKWLRAGQPVNVDQLNVGDKFNVDGEEFHVKGVNEDTGAVTIKDGITKEVPAGTWVHPDKGIVTKGEGDAAAGFEAQAKPDTTIADKAKGIADGMRKAKVNKGGLRSDITLGMWDGIVEIAAQTVEKGGTIAQAVANAIKRMRALKPDATAEHDRAVAEHVTALYNEATGKNEKVAPPAATEPEGVAAKHASTEASREKHNLPPREVGEPKKDTELARQAEEAARDPAAVDTLIKKVTDKPSTQLKDYEVVMLANHKGALEHTLEDAAKKVYDAQDRGDPAAEQDAKIAYHVASDKLEELSTALEKAGSEAGRAFRARGLEVRQDYSIAAMTNRLRMAKNGERLTDAEATEVGRLNKQIETLQAEHAKALKDIEDRASLAEMDNAHLRNLKAIEDEKKALGAKKSAPKAVDQGAVSKYLADKANAARQRLKDRAMGKIASSNPLIADLGDRAIIAADYIAKGINKIGEFAKEWRKEFGETSNQDIFHIWNAGNEEHAKAKGELAKAPAVGERDHAAERQSTLEGLSDALKDRDEADKPADINRYAQALALQKIRGGLHGRDAVIKAVHEDLKTVIPDMTEREARDAISGYGKYKTLDPEAAKAELRDIKGQAQQLSKLEDMKKGQAPKKTGVQQRERSDEERRLAQQVNEEKRKGGYDVTDPVKQLKSALEGVKSRLRNSIADLNFQIATGKKIVRTKTDVPRDAEATALEKKRDDLKAQFDSIFTKPELTDEQRLRLAQKSVDRQITQIQDQIKGGAVFDKERRAAPTSPELEASRARLDALKQEREYARQLLQPNPDPKTGAEIALQARKTRLAKRLADLQERVAKGDLSKVVKAEPLKNPAVDALAAKVEAVKQQFDRMVRAKELSDRPAWQKVADQISKGAHFAALTGYHSLEKLMSYSGLKMAELPVHEAVATLYSKTPGFRELYSKADFEGASSLKAVGKFYSGMATKGVRAMIDQLRTGTTEAKLLYGKRDINPPSYSNFPGNVHAAEKAPLLTGTTEIYKQKAAERGKADDETSRRAYTMAQRAILQEDNQAAAAINMVLENMKEVDPKTGHASGPKTALSELTSTALTKGIVRMPLNYIMQTLEASPLGGAVGLGKLAAAKATGRLSKLSPDEGNAIARLITKGAGYGAGLFALGVADGLQDDPKDRHFGGYYQPGQKRDPNDVPVGAIRLFDHTIPHLLTHNPTTEVAQMGSTLARTLKAIISKDAKAAEKNHAIQDFWDKASEGTEAAFESAVATLVGLIGQAPVPNTVFHASDLSEAGAGRRMIGNVAGGMVPQILGNIAADTDKGNRRNPQSVTDSVKMQIPGLRSQVPLKAAKPPSYKPPTRKLFGTPH